MVAILTAPTSILDRNMAVDGRIARLRIDISDEPGMLANYRIDWEMWRQYCGNI